MVHLRQNLQKMHVILGQVSPERKNLQKVLEILGQKVLEILGQESLERQNLQNVLEILGQNLQKELEILGQESLERQNLQNVLEILGQVSLEMQNLKKMHVILGQFSVTVQAPSWALSLKQGLASSLIRSAGADYRKKAILFQKIQRQMEQSAEGLDVSSDVIRRVLKSKFVPTLEKKLKQDQKVLQKAGPAHSLRQLPGPGDAWELLSACRPVSGAEASSQGHGHSTALRVTEPNTQSTNTPRRQKGRNKGVQSLEKESFVPVAAAQGQHRELQKYSTSGCEGARGIDNDGLPSVKELEALKARELGEQNFSSK
ncbi:hypothetical protein QTO34_017019, partial [Cnephaeus nilssonii]